MSQETEQQAAEVTGSCLCGTVRWRARGPFGAMSHCHCSMCRKIHAAPFGTYLEVPQQGFRWTAGEETIVSYESSPGFLRAFCGICGSVLPESAFDDPIYLPAGCLDDDPGVRPSAHIFATSKAPWHEIGDDLPRFDGYPKPEDGPNVARLSPWPARAAGDPVRGSCLCGDVAFEVRGPFKAAHNCHCSRCRKARAAAHTTNGFVAADDLVFLRGEERLKRYKVPNAKRFTHVFCERCGSGMPRRSPEAGFAVVPFGPLDDDPGFAPQDHIFVGSMAPWYEIPDELPRFENAPD